LASRSLAVAAWSLLSISAATQGRPLPDRVRDYIDRFEREASALAAEEDYVQRLEESRAGARVHSTRWLRSDYVLVKPADTEPWLGYRDIFEVDGVPVRERDARVVHILSTTAPDSLARAAAFVREGSRFNLGPERTINTPTLPMLLLARDNARRFRVETPRGWERQLRAIVTFSERSRPTIVRTPEGSSVASRGTMTVRVVDGAIVAADLRFRFQGARRNDPDAVLRVEYGDVPGVAVPVPLRMTEELPMPDGRASGVAVYSNYRRFQTSARIR